MHAKERQGALAFTAVAIFQIGWGVLALTVQNRPVAIIGACGNLGIAVGWILSQTSGIGFVRGLEGAASAPGP